MTSEWKPDVVPKLRELAMMYDDQEHLEPIELEAANEIEALREGLREALGFILNSSQPGAVGTYMRLAELVAEDQGRE